jgi:hypothetical protein
MSKSGTGKDTKRILVEVSNYIGCPAAQGGTLDDCRAADMAFWDAVSSNIESPTASICSCRYGTCVSVQNSREVK